MDVALRDLPGELRRIIDVIPQHVYVADADGNRLYANQAALDYHGVTLDEWRAEDFIAKIVHPEDLDRMVHARDRAIAEGTPFEVEVRLRGKDGGYRWFLSRSNPLRDEHGRIVRWYGSRTDIDDRKRAEEALYSENLAQEIDRSWIVENIVGHSSALQSVLARIAKVAPTESTVLIRGETGTGKELVARAIHRRSPRSARAFISVSCAALPASLIASELFGHEKGAFTGAVQRRLGRFELADSGTIFLDEIGELPPETQIALLRVLQEREFERVGGTQSIQVNVRVIAATNRDLQAAMAAGTFRTDLFYRLNVFPIEMPPLRERRADNSSSNSVSSNVRLRWEYRPGSELFVVWNEQRDTTARRFPDVANQAFVVKINRLLRF